MNHKNNRRVKLTKKLLQDALLKLLSTHSLHEISICELCETADLNRSTFYKYYNSPYDLFEQVKQEMLEQTAQLFSENCSLSYKEQLIKLLTFILENKQFSQLMFNSEFNLELLKQLFQLSLDGPILKDIKGTTHNEILYKQEFYFYGTHQVIKRWLYNENRETPEQIAEIIMQFINFKQTEPKQTIRKTRN